MRQPAWWLPCLALIASACGGKTVEVLAGPEDPGAGGTGIPVSGDGRCVIPEQCGEGRVCHPDGQCHPAPFACDAATCGASTNGDCACSWPCSDGSRYEARCRVTPTGLVTCNCGVDGAEFDWTCVVEEPSMDACGLGPTCCTFPAPGSTPW